MIPPESIERIEIIKTAASAQYGSFFSKRMEFMGETVDSRLLMPSGKVKIKLNEEWSLNGSVEYADWGSETSDEKNKLLIPKLYAAWWNCLSFRE